MKKLIYILVLLLFSVATFAQETGDSTLHNKKGFPILPKKGDWAIGADASPYLSYLGNMLNNTSNNSLSLSENTLYGRYYLSDKSALRIKLFVYNSSNIQRAYVSDDNATALNSLSQAQVEDEYKSSYSSNELDLAYIKFRGYGRLQGFYGVEAGFSWSRSKYKYEYGNEMTTSNTNPSSYYTSVSNNQRILESDGGLYKNINLGLVAGVEYYFAPKMCIGTEITLKGAMGWKSQGNSKYEKYNGTDIVETDQANSPAYYTGSSLYSNYSDNFGGSLYLMFHF
jgi:hypothetical protein